MRRLLLAGIASVLLVTGGVANAISSPVHTFEVGLLAPPTSWTTNPPVSYAPGASIYDVFNFSVPTASTFFNVSLDILSYAGFPITNFTSVLTGAAATPIFTLTGPTQSYAGTLDSGTYVLTVTGTANATVGGQYNATLGTIAAVPEPEAYAMFLVGIGLIGAVARRRRRALGAA